MKAHYSSLTDGSFSREIMTLGRRSRFARFLDGSGRVAPLTSLQ
jgi:hypothetical protein